MLLNKELERPSSKEDGSENNKKKVRDFIWQHYNLEGDPVSHTEVEIAFDLVEIVDSTEIPHFEIPDKQITNASNETVLSKMQYLSQISEIQNDLYPSALTIGYTMDPKDQDKWKEELEVAPWVNMVYTWFRVINLMNTVNAIQEGYIKYTPAKIAGLARELYKLTTKYDGDSLLRDEEANINGEIPVEYLETEMREAGVRGRNPQRHVSGRELRYILQVIKRAYLRKE